MQYIDKYDSLYFHSVPCSIVPSISDDDADLDDLVSGVSGREELVSHHVNGAARVGAAPGLLDVTHGPRHLRTGNENERNRGITKVRKS